MDTNKAYNTNGEGRDSHLMSPGGKWWDPLGSDHSPDVAAELKVKEIKNGLLAILLAHKTFIAITQTCIVAAQAWLQINAARVTRF
jgi:hypothetical protein